MYRFRPRPIPTIAAALFIGLTVVLGNWQTRRAEEKLRLQPDMEAPPAQLSDESQDPPLPGGRRVTARGHFLAERTFLLDNRVYRGVPGYHVLTPLRIDAAKPMAVLVNRGWIAAGSSRSRLPDITTDPAPIEVTGIASIPLSRPYVLADEGMAGRVRQNVVIDRIEAEIGLPLQPLIMLQTSAAKDGLVRDWPDQGARADVHRAYALQWYVMAAVIFALWLGLNLKRKEQTV